MLQQLILLQIYEEEILLVLHIYIPQQPGRKHLAATKIEKKKKMLKENGPNKEEHPHTHRTHHMKQTVEGLHCTHCSSGTLHSTENCLHPYIPAQTGGDGREGNI